MRSLVANEVMHPGLGPVLEAETLYVAQSRLAERLCDGSTNAPLVLFDVGLGAGSNAIAAFRAAHAVTAPARRLAIISFERDLEPFELASAEEERFGFTGAARLAARALLAGKSHEDERVTWTLVRGELPGSLVAAAALADVIFWDPYSPRANPELWTIAAFAAARAKAGPHATLFTYSASTASRAALVLAGWAVGAGASTGNKGETTMAAIEVGDLVAPLERQFLRRIALVDAPRPLDAPVDWVAQVGAAAQFTSVPR